MNDRTQDEHNERYNADVSSDTEEFDNTIDESYNEDADDELDIEDEDEEANSNTKITKLRKELNACIQKRDEYLANVQRLRADYVNAREEEKQKRAELKQEAKADMIEELLPVLDSFHMAFADTDAWEQVDETWRKGVEHIYHQLMRTIEDNGVTTIDPKAGDPFDPHYHSSLQAIDAETPEQDNTIAAVLQKGYMTNEKIIRPANVRVYVRNGAAAEANTGNDEA